MFFAPKKNWLQFYPLNDRLESRQPETRAIMNWVKERRFTASASLHGVTLLIFCMPLYLDMIAIS